MRFYFDLKNDVIERSMWYNKVTEIGIENYNIDTS